MRFAYNNPEEIITKLEAERAYKEAAAKAWSAVVIAKKKDGNEFANLTLAIKDSPAHISTRYGKSIEVCVTGYPQYRYDDINIRKIVKYGTPSEDMTAEEIREAIAKRVQDCKDTAKDLERQIKVAKEAFNNYRNAIAKAEADLAAIANNGGKYPSSLFYMIMDNR